MGVFSFFRKRKKISETKNDIKSTEYEAEKNITEDKSDSCNSSLGIDESIQETENIRIKLDSIQKIIEGLQQQTRYEDLDDYDPTLDLSHYSLPSTNLLKMYTTTDRGIDIEEQNENKNKIITTLQNYGIEIISIKATVGSTITLYEIVPKAGTRVAKIRQTKEDLAFALLAPNLIIEPLFEKGTIGISVPNKEPHILPLQEVIASKTFIESKYELPIILGKTETNQNLIIDLAQDPHILVAGATGQGKSVLLNVIITSLLYKKHPAEVKLVLIDPRRLELNLYSVIEKHYLAKLPRLGSPIISDYNKAAETLNSLQLEMDERYQLFVQAGVRSIYEYNNLFKKRRLSPRKGHKYLPHIVTIVDEYSDLIMAVGKEIELPLIRLTRQAHTVGMHIVLSTQRPTEKIITGNLKSNFPIRVAFKVTSAQESRMIIEKNGAEDLSGAGDALYNEGITTTRIQVPYISTAEVMNITNYIGEQQGYSDAFELPEFISEFDSIVNVIDLNERDALFEEAARVIVVHQSGSTSLIQRKFSIGYNRAERLMDELEVAGIIGSAQGSKPRDVLVMDEYSLEKLLTSLDNN